MPLQNPLSDRKRASAHLPVTRTGVRIRAERAVKSDAAARTREQHEEARQRVYRTLDALQLVSKPFVRPTSQTGRLTSHRVESQIDVFDSFRLQSWPLVTHKTLSWWRSPDDTVSLSSYSFNKPPKPRETHYRVAEEDVQGWVFPFILGGRKPASTKDMAHAHNPHTLIIAKDKTDTGEWRSWMGGMQAYDPEQEPRILALPARMAVRGAVANAFYGGYKGDRAIDGITRIDARNSEPVAQIESLWKIGNAVIERGRLAEVDFLDALSVADQHQNPPHMR